MEARDSDAEEGLIVEAGKASIPRRPGRPGWGRLGGLLSAVLLAGCSDAVLPLTTTWEADVRPQSPSQEAFASVGVLSQAGRAQVSIQMALGETGEQYGWNIQTGGCDATGDFFGGRAQYPLLEPGSNGLATGETVLSRELNPEGSYAARLTRVTATEEEIPVACGALVRTR